MGRDSVLKLLNVLYVTTPDAYVTRDGQNVVVRIGEEEMARVPVHILESIVCFSYVGVSPGLMALCAEAGVSLAFLTPQGKFLARVLGPTTGNVLLRREQYRIADDPDRCASIARNMVAAKIANSRSVLRRALRDHRDSIDVDVFGGAVSELTQSIDMLGGSDLDTVRGIEGRSAQAYFACFDQLILNPDPAFRFEHRSRRPPKDPVNAMLSFVYALLRHDIQSALESVGLDPYVGFLHRDRPGRPGLALDLMEELRPYLADRLVLSLVNRRQVSPKGFVASEAGGIRMSDEVRRTVLTAWQQRKQETINHPFLERNIQIGLLPHVQALLLARHIRGDLDEYPPFFSG